MRSLIFFPILLMGCCASTLTIETPVIETTSHPVEIPAPLLLDLKELPQNALTYLNHRCSYHHQFQTKLDQQFNQQFFAPWSQRPRSKTEVAFEFKIFRNNLGFGENKQKHSPSWISNLLNLANLSTYPNLQKQAITIRNTYLRRLPTHQPHFNDFALAGEGYPFDNLQQSAVWANTPLLASHFASDQSWVWVESSIASGWLPTEDLAWVDNHFITAWKTGHYVALIQDKVAIVDDNQIFRFKTHIGAMFPKIAEEPTHYQVLIAIADENRQAVLTTAHLSKTVAVLKPWSLTSVNLATVINAMLGQSYGWGGLYENRDCSSTTKDLFMPFGLWLPRNSAVQAKTAGQFISLKHLTPLDKEHRIIQRGIPYLTLLWAEGHIMLYIGTYQQQALVFHNPWGIKTKDSQGQEGREVVGQAIITSLRPGQELANLDPQKGNLLKNILGMTLLVPGVQCR